MEKTRKNQMIPRTDSIEELARFWDTPDLTEFKDELEEVVEAVFERRPGIAERLTQQFGNGFSHSGLTRMVKFYGYLPEGEMVATLSQPLSWSHFVELIKIEDELKREFYIRMCAEARWSVRALRERIDNMLFERTAISKQPDALIQRDLASSQQTPRLFLKDPYLLDFLDLKDNFSEKDSGWRNTNSNPANTHPLRSSCAATQTRKSWS
jgi:hypothetical protein